MPSDGFSFAVGIGCQDYFTGFFGEHLEFMHDFFLASRNLIMWNKSAFYVYGFFV